VLKDILTLMPVVENRLTADPGRRAIYFIGGTAGNAPVPGDGNKTPHRFLLGPKASKREKCKSKASLKINIKILIILIF
jgi:hypothetical protein